MQPTAKDSTIRVISLLRRIGSVFVIFIIFAFLASDIYHTIHDRVWISDLRRIQRDGVSKLATVEEEYEIVTVKYQPHLTFSYSFEENNKSFRNKYTLHSYLPKGGSELTKIFTVHYLKDDPDKNSLNVEDEIRRTEKKIKESSTFWFIFKIVLSLVFGLILLIQILSLISEIKNINKPIAIPDYLKK